MPGAMSPRLSQVELRRFLCLRAHLFHEFTHSGNVTRSTSFNPSLEPSRGFFQMSQEQRIREPLATFLDRRLHALPNEKELAARLEEQIFIEQAMIEVGASLVPVADHHHVRC